MRNMNSVLSLKNRALEIWNHAGFQKYFRNTGWMFVGRIFSLVISFVVSVYMARNLGVENFGTLNFIVSFVSIAGPSIFVIESLILKKLVEEPENKNKILGSALLIKIITSFFLIISSTTAAFFFSNNKNTILLIFIFSTFSFFQSIHLIDHYFQANTQIKKVVPLLITGSIISAIIKIIIISLKLDLIYLVTSYVFDYFFIAIGYIYLYKKYVGKITKWNIDKNLLKYYIIKSIPFTISSIATTIYIKVDQIYLKVLLDSQAVGLYSVAVRFSEVWFFISSVICASLLPAILNSQKTNTELFVKRSKRLFSFLFYLSILICIIIYISAPLIINTLYGYQYFDSIILLRIYIWSIIGFFINTALQQILLAQNMFKLILLTNIIGMFLSLILNYYFINKVGINGAAIANVLSYNIPIVIIMSLRSMKLQRKVLLSAIFKPLS